MSTWLLIYFLTSLTFVATLGFKWTLFTTIASIISLLFFGTLGLYFKSCTATSFYLLFVCLWLLALLWLLFTGRASDIVTFYALPVPIVLLAKWGISALKLAVTIPLFVPVVFIVVLAPLLTEDPWRLASEAGFTRIAILAAISLSPLAVFVVRRIWRISSEGGLAQAFATVRAKDDAHARATEVILRAKVSQEKVERSDLETRFFNAFRKTLHDDCISYIVSKVDIKFRRMSLRRLMILVAGIAISTFAIVYLLAIVAMPTKLALDWSKVESASSLKLTFANLVVTLPTGPHLSVSVLFATLATAGFLAFASTDDKYADAITGAIVVTPAERLAYAAIIRHHIAGHEGCKNPT